MNAATTKPDMMRRAALCLLAWGLPLLCAIAAAQSTVLSPAGTPADGWHAQWISGDSSANAPYLGRDFTLSKKKVKRAMLRATALGVYTMQLNGQPVSNSRLEPGESQWDQTVVYSTFDVTHLLRRGQNRLLAIVGGGLYNIQPVSGRYSKPEIHNTGTPALLAELLITYADGTTETIATDHTWHTAPSPVVASNWWGGEDYDARLEASWRGFEIPDSRDADLKSASTKKTDISHWPLATLISQPTTNLPIENDTHFGGPGHRSPIGTLRPREHEPVEVVETWTATGITPLANGDYIVDFGQNFAGIFEFTLQGKRGQTLRFQTSEQLNADGTVNAQECYCGPIVVFDTYTFGRDGMATWSPQLMYHGFRYMQVSGLAAPPRREDFRALRLRVAAVATGQFHTSHPLINQIHRICRNAIESQLFNVFTDCPQREKMGWLDVPNQMYNSIALNFDFSRLSRKIAQDCFDAQSAYAGTAREGKVPSTVPHFFNDWDDDPNWGGAAILVPYRAWKTYGDTTLVRRHYDGMRRLIDYYTRLAGENHVMPGSSYSRLSDWGQGSSGLDHETAPEFTITCTYYYLLTVMAEMAVLAGHADDAATYRHLAEQTRAAFNERFLNFPDTAASTLNQAELAMPLYYGLIPDNLRQHVADQLAAKVVADGYKIKTGECGLKPVLMSLARYGHNDIVWQMACQRDYPSYGYFVDNGCTTTPELWNMRYSQNHCMLAHIEEWFYTCLAGIQNDGTAYDHVRLQPYVPAELDSLSASVNTPRGAIVSEYHRQTDGTVRFRFSIPTGTTATIALPDGSTREVGAGDFETSVCIPAQGGQASEEEQSPIGSWQTDKAGLPCFEYTGQLPYQMTLESGDSVKLNPDPWFVLGNYQLTVFAHVSGQYELITGQRAWARMNQGDEPNTGQNDARLEMLDDDGEPMTAYPLVGIQSLAADPAKSRRTFGCGYARYDYQAGAIQVSRVLSTPPSTTISGGASAFLLRVTLKNQSRKPQRIRYTESIRACYETMMQQRQSKEWRKVKYLPKTEHNGMTVKVRFKAETDDPMLLAEKDDLSKYEGFPPVLFVRNVTAGGQPFADGQDIGTRYELTLHPREQRELDIIIGYSMERPYSNIEQVTRELTATRDYSDAWRHPYCLRPSSRVDSLLLLQTYMQINN